MERHVDDCWTRDEASARSTSRLPDQSRGVLFGDTAQVVEASWPGTTSSQRDRRGASRVVSALSAGVAARGGSRGAELARGVSWPGIGALGEGEQGVVAGRGRLARL